MGARREINLLGALAVALADGQRDVMRQASGLSDSEVAALNVVGNGRGMTIGQVRAALGLTHPGTVPVVDRLVAAGMVTRTPVGRTVSLDVTLDGGRAFAAQKLARVTWLTPFAAALEAEGIEDVEAVLDVLLGLTQRSFEEGEHVCRLCDESVCPQESCPVTLAVGKDP